MDLLFPVDPAGSGQLLAEQESLLACNRVSSPFGLSLSPSQARELALRHRRALFDAGRIEFGEGILPRLIAALCDSPYLQPDCYAQTLAELQDIFYLFKNDCGDSLSDEELLCWIERNFSGKAAGDIQYLADLFEQAYGFAAGQKEDRHE
ncbi:MAG: DUF6323 family protein [Oscillospiraceae bacterium]|nr:DUF6323 family protein [Oscillospiraceae bacterium]